MGHPGRPRRRSPRAVVPVAEADDPSSGSQGHPAEDSGRLRSARQSAAKCPGRRQVPAADRDPVPVAPDVQRDDASAERPHGPDDRRHLVDGVRYDVASGSEPLSNESIALAESANRVCGPTGRGRRTGPRRRGRSGDAHAAGTRGRPRRRPRFPGGRDRSAAGRRAATSRSSSTPTISASGSRTRSARPTLPAASPSSRTRRRRVGGRSRTGEASAHQTTPVSAPPGRWTEACVPSIRSSSPWRVRRTTTRSSDLKHALSHQRA